MVEGLVPEGAVVEGFVPGAVGREVPPGILVAGVVGAATPDCAL